MDEQQPIQLEGVTLEAYRLHIEALVRAEVEAELAAVEEKRNEFLRGCLKRNASDPAWTQRRDMVRAARERRAAEIAAAQTRESA